MTRFFRVVALLTAAAAFPAAAQVWDFTGNGQLNGAYVFRELITVPANRTGGLSQIITVSGTITFNGNGGYSISANALDSRSGAGTYTDTGSYSISASGYGFISHPYATSGNLHGMVSNGVFIGSATENGINDFMIAIPANSATNATLSGNYTLNYIHFPGATQTTTYNSVAQLNPNGNGNIGSVPVKTYLGGNSTTPVNQTETGVTYSFASGVGTMRFPTTTNLAIRGNKTFYASADGNFFFGGGADTWDFIIGVKRGSPPRMEGLYYSAGVNHLPVSLDTFYGSLVARGTVVLEHQRYLSTATASGLPVNYTASGVLPADAVTDYTDEFSQVEYTVSQDASIRIGIGKSPYLGMRIAVRGPVLTAPGSGPYINPTGVINAASFAPFTSGVAPGELLSIYGENLAGSTEVTQGGVAFPSVLGGVRVLMNNRPAAIYFVSPGQIAAIVPYQTSEPIVQIQVERDGVLSNAVTAIRYATAPGIFSLAQTGEGLGAVLHADYSLVTEDNPARRGETIQVFLTGIGPVFPGIVDGALGSATEATLNRVQPGTVAAGVDNIGVEPAYAGLAPGLAGLYQMNITVPSNAGTGNVFLDISAGEAFTSQVILPVTVAASAAEESGVRKAEPRPFVRRR